MHTDTDTVDIDDIDAALDASADDKEQDAAPTFAELGVPKPLVHVLAMDGKVTAFPIQADTLSDSLSGVDLLGRGQTGSGKTLAFAIPLVARLSEHSVTEVAMKEQKLRVEDALNATRAAVEEGIVAGGGTALINAIPEVQKLVDSLDGDERTGAKIVLKALEEPVRQIAINAGVDGSVIVNTLLTSGKIGYGYDAYNETYVDMIPAGIVDPTKVTRSALQNAASVAAMVLTTESLVADQKEDNEPAGAPAGMGGMM